MELPQLVRINYQGRFAIIISVTKGDGKKKRKKNQNKETQDKRQKNYTEPSYPKDLELGGEGNGNPIGLGRGPLQLLNLSTGGIGKDGIEAALDRLAHRREVPDERLGIVPGGADVARAVGGPGNSVDAGLVPLQLDHGEGGKTDVEDDDLGALHNDGGHVPGVLLVPPQADQRGVGLGALVDDGRVLLVPEVKNPDRAVRRD